MTVISITKSASFPDFNSVLKNSISIKKDWFGEQTITPPEVFFGIDQSHFHFFSRRKAPALIHPGALPGKFQPELWKYDVAEFFLAAPDHSEYLEFNLAPNGAWWSCFFSAPRVPSRTEPLANVITKADLDENAWQVQASIPLSEIPWPIESCFLNATLILDSPAQRFFSLAHLGEGDPDFHRPSHFLPISLSS